MHKLPNTKRSERLLLTGIVCGLTLPIAVAPYHVALVALARTDETREKAEALYQTLLKAGIEVLFDDVWENRRVSALSFHGLN